MTKLDLLEHLLTPLVREAALSRALEGTPIPLSGRDGNLALLVALEINPHIDLSADEHASLVHVSSRTLATMRNKQRIRIPVNG